MSDDPKSLVRDSCNGGREALQKREGITGSCGMAPKRELLVNSVRTVPIDGIPVTPTAIRYTDKGFVIGHDAIDDGESTTPPIDDFKIALGSGDYGQLSSKMAKISSQQKRSVVGIAQDFIITALKSVNTWADHNSISPPKHVIVAEPLALEDAGVPGESWLANYRSNIRRILHSFEEVDFLPEPFAVFQYYRYGVRHPLISERKKHVALVLDFGGGTFDACIIETTAQGDISQSGRNQRPLSSKSVATAGYFINRRIAEYLLFKAHPDYPKNRVVRTALDLYTQGRWRQDDPTISAETHSFIGNFSRLVQFAEKAKIAIGSNIVNWDLEANLSAKVPVRVRVPARPFSSNSEFHEISFDADELRQIFVNDVWIKKLKPSIQDVLRRAGNELEGNPISMVLLSGGSSNLRWIRKLIERDLASELEHAEILELAENFQEIVSKGLAVECARRYFTEGEGDFQAVLYNKICLLLSPNGRGIELRRFRPVEPADLPDAGEDAVLLPSASSLRSRFDRNLTWKVKLSSSPSQNLEYHFMRSSFDPTDLEGQLNIIQKNISTPKGTTFGQSIDIQLNVRADGTATPSFVYGRGNIDRETTVVGTPFFLDMTTSGGSAMNSYIGFDFGSSTSSFSIVSRADVSAYRDRGHDASWKELSDIVGDLPYPIAAHIGRYLGETNSEMLSKRGRAAFESCLCILAYLTYGKYRTRVSRQKSNLFKGLSHRSAGPLWGLLRDTLIKLPAEVRKTLPANRLFEDPHRSIIEQALVGIQDDKHQRAGDVDFNRILRLLCNIVNDTLDNCLFGYFEEIRQRAFSSEYEGIFRNLKGSSEPFVELFEYRGRLTYPKNQIVVVNLESKSIMDLTPLYIWGLNSICGDGRPADLFMYDNAKGNSFFFNAVQERPGLEVTQTGALTELWDIVGRCRTEDLSVQMQDASHFVKR